MTLYVVVIQDEYGDSQSIHSIFKNKDEANNEVKMLSSSLKRMIAFVEEHDLKE